MTDSNPFLDALAHIGAPMPAPRPARPVRPMPATGLVDQVDRIVTALGFAETTPTRALSDVVEHHFADKGVKVTVIDLRYGTLTIAASPRDVALVHADTPAVIEAARDNGLELDDLRVRTRR